MRNHPTLSARLGRPIVGLTILSMALCGAFVIPARGATPEQVRKSIADAKAFLYSKQKPDGSWDEPAPDPVKNDQWGGRTALATYALLAGGETPQDPRMAKAINWLYKSDKMDGVYAIGLRAQVWPFLPVTKETK